VIRRPRGWPARSALGLGALLLSGCATYRPLPLPAAPDLAATPALVVPAGRFALPGLQPHPIDPAAPWDVTTVVTLAVLGNPGLKAARLQAGVADAQLLAAGLLPDPVLGGGLSRSAVRSGYSLGLSADLQALITRSARRGAAAARVRQVNLEILWQEWQVAARARDLFLQAGAQRQLAPVLGRIRSLYLDRARADQSALDRGEVTAEAVSPDLAALNAADAALRQLQLDANRTDHDLDALLGLSPQTRLRLRDSSRPRLLTPEEFQAAVAALPNRRVDLLALQAGYQSQEASLRAAVLAQFPSLGAGVEQARSAEEGVHTTGFSVSLTLPLFDRNRGQIAAERATRAALRQTYQARLDQAAGQADQVWQSAILMARQLHDLEARMAGIQASAAAAGTSFQRGNLAPDTYAALTVNSLTAQADAIRLRSSLAQAEGALEILLGLPLDARPAG
jgi:outer membrane protein, heavy metal efflux system